MILRIRIISLLLCVKLGLTAQLQVKNFTTLAGKKEVPVYSICQDHLGYLWLGSNQGLYRFDGKNAIEISKNVPALNKRISALSVDNKDKLWIGTESGKVYTLTKDRLDSIDFGTKPNAEKISAICCLDSVVGFGTYGNGVYLYKNGMLSHITTDNGLSDNVIYHLESDARSRIWCSSDAGFTSITYVNGLPRLETISYKSGLPDNIVRHIAYQNEQLLVSMQDSGVAIFDLNKNVFTQRLTRGVWNKGAVVKSSWLGHHRFAIATENNGLVYIAGNEVHEYDYRSTIQSGNINGFCVDASGELWLASAKGVSVFNEKRFSLINNISGITDHRVLAISAGGLGNLWIGTTMGVSKLSGKPEGNYIMAADHHFGKLTISCAATAPDGSVWYGTYGSGIVVINPDGSSNTEITSRNSELSNDNISNITFDGGVVYISTLGGGLIKASIGSGKKKSITNVRVFNENDGLGNSYVYCSINGDANKIYVATDGGGLQILENGRFSNLTANKKFSSATVFSLCKDKYENVWAVTSADGILKIKGDSILKIDMEGGLRDLQPSQIIAVDNTLYAFNSRGIDKINCLDNTVSYYDLFDFDIEPSLNAVSYSGGCIYSGTGKGILIFRTEKESSDTVKPTAVISGLLVNYKPFNTDSVRYLKYDQNNISINFQGVWLKNPDKLLFRYKLKGLEENWQIVSEGKSASYNNLGPGSYTFVVQTRNEEDVWSEPAEFIFEIATPLWKRWWFWLLIVASGILVIYVFVRYRLQALQKENLLLEQRVAERTREIEEQSNVIAEKNKELEQLSLVASRTDNVVWILDPQGRLEFVNESFFKRNNITEGELRERFGDNVYQISNNPEIREIIQTAINNRQSVKYESLNKHISSGFEVWESSTLTPIFGDDGELRKLIIIDTDVSESKRQEQIISQKNKDITDSINYARRIQQAILPREEFIRKHLPDSFVFYLTKDIVSGDFYWFSRFEKFSIIAAIDCTGHGVPGAFMSLIGYNILNRVVNERKVTNPADILRELNEGVINVLHKNSPESKDGMDVAICKINHEEKTLEYAGAMRPLWIVNESGLHEIKADKIPIGTRPSENEPPISYTCHEIKINPNDAYYIFTDGFADQFGGPKAKKFSTARLKELLIKNHNSDFRIQERNLRNEHYDWKGHTEQVDDILVIGFSVKN